MHGVSPKGLMAGSHWGSTILIRKQNWRLHPRMEATLSLRYASLLYDETDNNTVAETVLSKGVCYQSYNFVYRMLIWRRLHYVNG